MARNILNARPLLIAVARLNHLLSRYQEAYPNLTVQQYGGSPNSDKEQPWLTDKKELSPLLAEYDNIIQGLQGQIKQYQTDLTTLKSHIQEFIAENESLRIELKDTLHAKLSSKQAGGGDGNSGDDEIVAKLQRQMDITMQEKEAAQERWRETAQEVDRLEAELEMEKENHQWKVVESQAHQVKDQYQQSVTTLNAEVETLQNQLSESHSENGILKHQIMELKITMNNLEQQIIWKDKESADNIFKEGFSDSKTAELKRIMDDLRHRLSVVSKECDDLRFENTSLHARLSELQRRLAETEGRENEAITQVRDAVQMVEASVLEKDQIEVLARQKEEEVEEMRKSLAKVINKAGARTREEVDNVRKQCNDRIEKLTEEVHALEMEGTEKQARLDRLLREKRAVESELQQLYKDGMVEGSKSKAAFEEMNKRAIKAERVRDESVMKMDTLHGEVSRQLLDNKQLKELLDSKTKQLQERISSTQAEFEEVSEDRLECKNKLNEMDQKLLAAQQERDVAQRKYLKELALIKQDQQVKTRDFEIKVQAAEDTRRQTVSELRRLLTAQQKMSARWKEECQTVTNKFENKILDMRNELSHSKRRNDELTSLLQENQAKTLEVERLVSDYTKNIRRMEQRVHEAENQVGEASEKLCRQSLRERQITNEKETLLAELGRSQSKQDVPLEQSGKPELTFDQLNNSTPLLMSDTR